MGLTEKQIDLLNERILHVQHEDTKMAYSLVKSSLFLVAKISKNPKDEEDTPFDSEERKGIRDQLVKVEGEMVQELILQNRELEKLREARAPIRMECDRVETESQANWETLSCH